MKPEPTKLSVTDEDALVLRVQGGDLGAFEPLVDQHIPYVRAFIALRTPAAHLVDELAHETFVFAFRNINEFKAGTSFAGWLRAIAWNLLRAELQRFSRDQANQARYAHEHRLALLETQLESGPSRESEFLQQCVEKLPGTMRELVDLKYQQDQSSEQIAQSLRRSPAWVWTSLFRVRQQLKECIERKLERRQPC